MRAGCGHATTIALRWVLMAVCSVFRFVCRYLKDLNETAGQFNKLHRILPATECGFAFHGVKGFMCPRDVEYLLVQQYGQKWRIPMAGFKSWDTPDSDRDPE